MFFKNSRKFPKAKFEFTVLWQLLTYHLHCIYKYLHSICIVLGIIKNLEIIECRLEDVCRLYANTTPFYIRGLSMLGFWYLYGSWNQSLEDTEGWLYHILCIYSPVGGHFDCFKFGAIIKNAAMNICKHMSSCGHMFLLLLSRCLVMECWMIYYIFKVTVKLFPKVTMPFYIHICSVWEFIIKIWFLGSSLAA